MMHLPDLVVFDFAGTVLRDDGLVIAAYGQALTRHGILFDAVDLAARRGANKRAVFRELAERAGCFPDPAAVAASALAVFETALTDAYATGAVAEIPGAAATIAWLRTHGAKVALTSGFNRALMDRLLDRLGWRDQFHATIAGDDVPLGRPAPYLIFQAMIATGATDVRRVAVVGDTPLDLQAGMNAGAGWVIGVLSGAHGLETLGATPHTHLLPSVADLPRLFKADK